MSRSVTSLLSDTAKVLMVFIFVQELSWDRVIHYASFLNAKILIHHGFLILTCHVCRIVMLFEVIIAGSFMTAYISKYASLWASLGLGVCLC